MVLRCGLNSVTRYNPHRLCRKSRSLLGYANVSASIVSLKRLIVSKTFLSCQNQQSGLYAQRRLRSVWASAVRTKKASFLIYPLSAQRRLLSDWADTQADPSLRWAHNQFFGFVIRRLKREVLCSSFKLLSSCSFTSVAVTLCITASAKS